MSNLFMNSGKEPKLDKAWKPSQIILGGIVGSVLIYFLVVGMCVTYDNLVYGFTCP